MSLQHCRIDLFYHLLLPSIFYNDIVEDTSKLCCEIYGFVENMVIVYCVCLISKTIRICFSSFSFVHHFHGITGNSNGEIGAKEYFTDHWKLI